MTDKHVPVSRLLLWMAWNRLASRNAPRYLALSSDLWHQRIWLHPLQAPPVAAQLEPGVRLVAGLNFREITTFLQVFKHPPRDRLSPAIQLHAKARSGSGWL